MLVSKQVLLLSEMGIPTWQLRQDIALEKLNQPNLSKCVQVDNTALLRRIQPASWLLCHDSELSQQIQRLMQAMLLSIGVLLPDVCFLTPKELKQIASEDISNPQQKRLLIFGELVTKQVFGESATIEQLRYEPQLSFKSELATIVSLDLDSLLHTPANKKQVWQDLRLAKQIT